MNHAIEIALPQPQSEHGGKSPLDWKWPAAPALMTLFDKYSGRESVVRLADRHWEVFAAGSTVRLEFAEGQVGELQRALVLLTRRASSPAPFRTFANVLIAKWPAILELLATPAEKLRETWTTVLSHPLETNVAKAVLKLACKAGAGHWRVVHMPLVKSLDTFVKEGLRQNKRSIGKRERVASVDAQAAIVRVLDAAASEDDLTDRQVEGAVALLITYQHGMRPVQALCLDVTHVRFFRDASDDLACVLSFHAAKQTPGNEFELLRQVKPEWVPLVARLHATALAHGRQRLFNATGPITFWDRAVVLCKRFSVQLDSTARSLRHTGAQTLADAGHDRASIQAFLGHKSAEAASHYIRASFKQAELINTALGASKLYNSLLDISTGSFVSADEIQLAPEDQQIGAVVGYRLVAGVGLCKAGQSSCAYNPVTSCYGCPKFMPSLDRESHVEAIEGMRDQVRLYLKQGISDETPAYRQLTRALAGAQQALTLIDDRPKNHG